jgi:hypothetical protein
MVEKFIREVVLASGQHTCFYHFTDRRNLASIQRAAGILSMKELKDRGIVIPAPGGNDVSVEADRKCGMDDYVHLCFTRGHPMAHIAVKEERIKDIVWLRINPEIIKINGALITNDVSNKNGVTPKEIRDSLAEIDLEVIYKRLDRKDPIIHQRLSAADKYEILIPEIVPIEYVLNPNG